MLLVSVLSAAIAPGISLLTYLYLKDRYEAEPIHIVIKMFVLGMLVVVPIMVIQRGMQIGLGDYSFVFAYIESAGVEEFVKWFILFQVIYNHTEFDEPYDGILYAAAISLGFATAENVLYAIFAPSSFGTLLARALLPVSGHAIFGVMMGYYFGKAKFAPKHKRKTYLAISFLLPITLHGTYDWIIVTIQTNWMWFAIPFIAGLWIWGLRKMKRAHSKSPFRMLVREEQIKF